MPTRRHQNTRDPTPAEISSWAQWRISFTTTPYNRSYRIFASGGITRQPINEILRTPGAMQQSIASSRGGGSTRVDRAVSYNTPMWKSTAINGVSSAWGYVSNILSVSAEVLHNGRWSQYCIESYQHKQGLRLQFLAITGSLLVLCLAHHTKNH